jgi:homocysteine S-methyltransferase
MPSQDLLRQGERIFLTDGGIETVLIYEDGIPLPEFASFPLLDTEAGRSALRRYFRRYLDIAAATPDAGFILESPTGRASQDWGARLGYDAAALARVNGLAIGLMDELRDEYRGRVAGGIVISGCIGPRGDGYVTGQRMSGDEATRFHRAQAGALAATGAEVISAITMTSSNEGIGVARAAAEAGLPSVISFTVETDGRLPSGETLRSAIEATDREHQARPAYYMVNCAHPSHFEAVLADAGGWTDRIHGLRANASARSHAELNAATELDPGDPRDLGERYRRLRQLLPELRVAGGCCGTNHLHVQAIRDAWRRAD